MKTLQAHAYLYDASKKIEVQAQDVHKEKMTVLALVSAF